MFKTTVRAALAAALMVSVPVIAEEMTEGVIRKVNKDAAKLTIKHGEIKSLDMPPMTMVFRVKESAMLEQVSRGDQVKFNADKINGAYTLTHIEKSN